MFESYPFSEPFLSANPNLGRTAQCFYQYGDGHGIPHNWTKDHLISLLVQPIPLKIVIRLNMAKLKMNKCDRHIATPSDKLIIFVVPVLKRMTSNVTLVCATHVSIDERIGLTSAQTEMANIGVCTITREDVRWEWAKVAAQ
ncbi:hypothetical protein ACSBR2_012152 [Camellia fascicularis]